MNLEKDLISNLKIGDSIPNYSVIIDKKTYLQYNRLIKEINPLHFNKKYAQKMGFDDIVIAGNFLYAYLLKWIVNWVRNINYIKKINIKFLNPVYLNEEIVHSGKIIDISKKNGCRIITCEFNVKKNGEIITSSGTIILEHPK